MRLYDDHGIMLFPSLFEGFGKVPLESMARGLCLIASPVGGVPDLVSDGVDGVIVAPGDADALQRAALRLLDDTGFARAVSEAARRRALEFTWARVARESAAFYERLGRLPPRENGA